jgi:HSP20-like domain of unknown function (DUF1813).
MEKSCRTLKVYSTTGNPTPKINLQGKWLLELGFTIGDYIEVTANDDNQIVITKTEPKEVPKGNLKTTLAKQTIDVVKEQALHYKTDENAVIEKALLYYFKKKGVI